MSGSYVGIGIEVGPGGRVQGVLPGTPAAQAGLMPGNIIERINGGPVTNLESDQVVDRLRGEPGSKVRLQIVRPGDNTSAEIVVLREWLPLHPVRTRTLGTVAYIGLDHFDDFTAGRLVSAIASLTTSASPHQLTGFVLDLRGNPGGLVVQAVAVAGAFLGRGEIVRLVGRGPDDVERFALDRTGEDLIGGLPMIVLVNGNTASAAEIIAGSLQDHRPATLVGTRTYGKGAVQTTYVHRDGRGLRLTTAWVVTPSGRRVEGNGIEPDRTVTLKEEASIAADGSGARLVIPAQDEGALQTGIVDDSRIEPSRDPQLRADPPPPE